jgi:AcrR family transcriptional regulator
MDSSPLNETQDGDESVSPAPRKSRTQAERRAEAERRMLQAAVRILAEKGFAALTLNEVGEAAGYSRGLPAHYFGRKDELLLAVGRYIVSRFSKGLRRPRNEPPLEGLPAILRTADYYLASVGQDPVTMRALLVILTETTSHPDLFPALVELNRASVDGFAEQIRIGQRQGEIGPEIDPASHAVLILGQLRGIVTQWLIDRSTVDLDRVRASVALSLRRSLAP